MRALGRRRRGARRARLRDDRRLLGLRLPQGPRRGVRAARLPVDVAARALRPGVPRARCSTSSRWASTRPTRSSTRPSGAASRCCPPDVNASAAGCTGHAPRARVRLGLGYVLGVREDEVARARRRARGRRARSRSLDELASRAGAGRPALDQLAWSGACDALVAAERRLRAARQALWRLGVAAAPRPHGVGEERRSSRCRWSCRRRRRCDGARRLGRDARRLRDDRADDADAPARAAARRAAARRGGRRAADLGAHRARHARAGRRARRRAPAPGDRQRGRLHAARGRARDGQPVVPPPVYERDRLAVRTEPLVVAEGMLERFASGGGAVNVHGAAHRALETPGADVAARARDGAAPTSATASGAGARRRRALAAAAGFRRSRRR